MYNVLLTALIQYYISFTFETTYKKHNPCKQLITKSFFIF